MARSTPPRTGFTLIELLIALAVMAVLAAIAIPLYSAQVRKSHRTDIQTSMMELSVRQTSWRTNHTSYGTMTDVTGLTPAISNPSNSYYTVSVSAGASTYTITATPSTSQASDDCGTMTLNQSLVGTPSGCW
jgi:type IV pilus assembly protein PilE